jgi:hypothetical protein
LLPSAATFEFLFATIKDDDEFAENWPSMGVDWAIGNFSSLTLEKIFLKFIIRYLQFYILSFLH